MNIDAYRSRCTCYARGLTDHDCKLKNQDMIQGNFNPRDMRPYCKYCDAYHYPKSTCK